MKANAVPLLALFEVKRRLEVPLFQRQYVWNREHQWEPLWEDIARKFAEALEGRTDAPVHFLGAMVLDQKLSPSPFIERRQVIDGQQRLTTLQVFLAAFRDFCREQSCEDLAKELDAYTVNKGMMAEPEVDRFKVWPTQLDRPLFTDVVGLGSREAIEKKYPLTRRPYARKPDPRPRLVEAYLFFSDQIRLFFLGTAQEPPLQADVPVAQRVASAFQALRDSLHVVAIDLEPSDDAQVIFETLNARGEPLLPADLLRNYIFLRAARNGEHQEQLYKTYWREFDDPFWRVPIRQGRLIRPRSDLFMQHFLASRQTIDIPITHLYVEYRFWIERECPFDGKVEKELATLCRQGQDFRRLIEPTKGDCLYGLATFLQCFDIGTVYPLLLFLCDAGLTEDGWTSVSRTLESYLLRRAVLGWTTKSYNRVFLAITKALREQGATDANLRGYLSSLKGESVAWPDDVQFAEAWQSKHAYEVLNNPKLVHILKRLSSKYANTKQEQVTVHSDLTVEHLMPREWYAHWPLADGQQGVPWIERFTLKPDDPRVLASDRRNRLLHTIGNLTLLTQSLNSSVSNAAWDAKRPQLMKASLLPINQMLHEFATWDERAIEERGRRLLQTAMDIWPGPNK